MERIPPPEPRRNMRRIRKRSGGSFSRRLDALRETAGSAPHGAGLRPSGCGVPGSCRRPERLHRARHPCHKGLGIGLSGNRGIPVVSLFVQQSLGDPLSTFCPLAGRSAASLYRHLAQDSRSDGCMNAGFDFAKPAPNQQSAGPVSRPPSTAGLRETDRPQAAPRPALPPQSRWRRLGPASP